MFKAIFLALFMGLISFQTSAFTIEDDYTQTSLSGKAMQILVNENRELVEAGVCVIYIQTRDELIGVVEDYFDCYWSLLHRDREGEDIEISNSYFSNIEDQHLLQTLRLINPLAIHIQTFSE